MKHIREMNGAVLIYIISRFLMIGILPAYITDLDHYLALVEGNHWINEYPPLSYLFLSFPYFVAKILTGSVNLNFYRLLFQLTLLIFDASIFRVLLQQNRNILSWGYLFLSCCLSTLWFDRFDLIVAWVITGLALNKSSDRKISFFLAFGTAIKLVPLLVYPLLFEPKGIRKSRNWILIIRSLYVPLLISIFFVYYNNSGNIKFLTYHLNRGLQVESLWGSALLLVSVVFNIGKTHINFNYGAHHLAGTYQSHLLFLAQIILPLALLGLYLLFYKNSSKFSFSQKIFLLLSTFIIFNKVFSPQYLIWLVPVALLAISDISNLLLKWRLFHFFSLIVILTSIEFYYYPELLKLNSQIILLVNFRNILFLILLSILTYFQLTGANDNK